MLRVKILLVLLIFLSFQGKSQEEDNLEDDGKRSSDRSWFNSWGICAWTSGTYFFDSDYIYNRGTFFFQFRRNIVSFDDDASISLSLPLGVSFGLHNGDGFAIPIAMPLLLDFNIGMHSTYNNIDRYGGTISTGAIATVIPSEDGTLYEFGPAFKLAYKYPSKSNNGGIYALVGLGLDEDMVVNSFSAYLGLFHLINYGN